MKTSINIKKSYGQSTSVISKAIIFVLICSLNLFLYAQKTTTMWNGQKSSDWHNAENWTDGVPTPTVSAFIFGHSPNYPVISADASCLNLEIQVTSYLYINGCNKLFVYGNWTNNHDFIPDKGTVIFKGSISSINGINNNFYNLIVEKNSSSEKLSLNTDISVSNSLSLEKGDIYLNNKNIDLGTTGEIKDETNENKIYDDYLTGTGTITVTRLNLTPSYTECFGNIGLNITSEAYFGNTVVVRSHKKQSISQNSSSLYRYFDIIPANNSNLNAKLIFRFFNDEIPAGIKKEDLVLYDSKDGGLTWSNNLGVVYPLYNCIIKDNIEKFSRWTASDFSDSPTLLKSMPENDAKISIYPIPAKGFIIIDAHTNNKEFLVQIGDILGNAVISKKMTDVTKIDLAGIKPGIYYCKLTNIGSGKQYTRKLVID
jgi:hypothetical protein